MIGRSTWGTERCAQHTYYGKWDGSGRKHGYGFYEFCNGDTFQGHIEREKGMTQGLYNSSLWGKFVGKFDKGQLSAGVFTFHSGDTFDGFVTEFNSNKSWWKGKGLLTRKDGGIYEGEIRVDAKGPSLDGLGTMMWANTERYEGDWVGNKRHGRGIQTFLDGSFYQGKFKDDVISGKGVWTYRNGETYEGQMKGGLREGVGTSTYTNGFRYEGEWKGNKRHGKGVYTSSEGCRFEGEWREDHKHNGVETLPCGDQYEGGFDENNLFHGRGVYVYAKGGTVS